MAQETEPEKIKFSRKLRLWWRFQRRRDNADKSKPPCWKQYFTLFLASIVIGVMTVVVTSLMSVTPPLVDYFVVYSFGISFPSSLVLHIICRTLIRQIRQYLAIRRGYKVEGSVTKEELKGKAKRKGKNKGKVQDVVDTSTANPQAESRKSIMMPAQRRPSQGGGKLLGGLLPDADLEAAVAEGARRNSFASNPQNLLKSIGSAHLGSALLDAAPTLEAREACAAAGGSAAAPDIDTALPPVVEEGSEESAAAKTDEPPAPKPRASFSDPNATFGRAKSRGSALGRAGKILEATKRDGRTSFGSSREGEDAPPEQEQAASPQMAQQV